MKKLFALILALMMALTGFSALADSVYTEVKIDSEVATGLMTGFGVPEDQMGMVEPIIALVNALGVNVITADGGTQVDLTLNGSDALSLAFATGADGVTIASTLFPSYILTMSNETIGQMMEQFAANVPGAGGEGGASMADMAAMGEIFGGYYQRWMEACAAAGKPGDPVPGEYEFEGYTFDTMVPVTVDIPAIADATRSIMDEMMADPAAMAAIKGMAQGMAQNSGEEFDEENFEANFKAGFDEWVSHFPEESTAEFYCNGEESQPFYLTGESTVEDGSFVYSMLFVDETNMNMGFSMAGEHTMEAGFSMDGSTMSMYFSMDETYFAIVFSNEGDQILIDLYFMNADKPLLSISATHSEDGELTLSLDAAGKTVQSIEEIMGDQSGEAVQGLMGDLMNNGLGTLMGTLSSEVPEIAGLMGMFAGGMAG